MTFLQKVHEDELALLEKLKGKEQALEIFEIAKPEPHALRYRMSHRLGSMTAAAKQLGISTEAVRVSLHRYSHFLHKWENNVLPTLLQ